MGRFQNILVGVDLRQGDRLVGEVLSAPVEEAVKRAIWLAGHYSARITFMYSLEISERAQHLIEEAEGEPTVLTDARSALEKLVQRASAHGIEASAEVTFGRGWLELIRQVIRGQHDLLLMGTRIPTGARVLFGSTAMKVLRKCPCPVLVIKPNDVQRSLAAVLVAHDLTPVGSLALELGASFAELENAQLHVLHAIEHLESEHLPVGSGTAHAEHNAAHAQITAELERSSFSGQAHIHIVHGEPTPAILRYIDEHGVELLVMGTIARMGVEGMLTGNTAERLLPQIPCSLLAVKPENFVSPVR